jgi:hypothetical protein
MDASKAIACPHCTRMHTYNISQSCLAAPFVQLTFLCNSCHEPIRVEIKRGEIVKIH